MVIRLICIGLLLAFPFVVIGSAQAAHCGPDFCAPPMKVPVYGHPGAGMQPMPPGMPMRGPQMAGPRPMAGCCPPPCPPPACGPAEEGFHPVRALFSVITFPFRMIGSAFSKRQGCEQPTCMPAGCVPMMPACGPPPISKCKPGPMPKAAAFGYSPMGY